MSLKIDDKMPLPTGAEEKYSNSRWRFKLRYRPLQNSGNTSSNRARKVAGFFLSPIILAQHWALEVTNVQTHESYLFELLKDDDGTYNKVAVYGPAINCELWESYQYIKAPLNAGSGYIWNRNGPEFVREKAHAFLLKYPKYFVKYSDCHIFCINLMFSINGGFPFKYPAQLLAKLGQGVVVAPIAFFVSVIPTAICRRVINGLKERIKASREPLDNELMWVSPTDYVDDEGNWNGSTYVDDDEGNWNGSMYIDDDEGNWNGSTYIDDDEGNWNGSIYDVDDEGNWNSSTYDVDDQCSQPARPPTRPPGPAGLAAWLGRPETAQAAQAAQAGPGRPGRPGWSRPVQAIQAV
ncbi:hypothetical protein BDZ91DRAFT_794201 [Kalaharituber pfeilii]|nr:hypothetical protein BDZ91DRAFT_794201 [Kalaharituber pfeilii]